MPDEAGILGEESGDRGAKGGGGGREVFRPAEEADDVNHANPTHAPAILHLAFTSSSFFVLCFEVASRVPSQLGPGEGVAAAPDGDVAVVDPLQGGEGVG